ncbi:hypothetical protein GUITHDRAFT_75425 [Guillardia theta CCMP2712]|uniref:Uncharacterized protein n=1 Tax=Guillardia theta (strain CCMP2712) TaxID=905079 RepID=L1IXF1_GUITC|nr:hypothetical protein GUITHDRAFT_75425 [Guillardia theta CCMP2712]EKX40530.1 hypothetical protein GUITHDRAFT_75425 [Guillardia theta CCMP2712]|eukprot:XP_005827510.1 hypothetical protein GUITHDRAFT_75425 [Guillardia theta CCMP2712]
MPPSLHSIRRVHQSTATIQRLRGGGLFRRKQKEQPPPPPPPVVIPRKRTFRDIYFKVIETLTLLFPLWTFVLSGIALYNPDSFGWLTTEPGTLLFLSVVMLSIGTSLNAKDLYRVRDNLYPIGIAYVCRYAMTPLLGLLVSRFLSESLATGLILLSCCPGSQASNVACFIAGGDLPVSILMTLMSTVTCAVMTPLLLQLIVGLKISIDGVGMCTSMFQVVLMPILTGLVLNQYLPSVVSRIKEVTPLIGVLLTSCLVAAPVAGVRDELLNGGLELGFPVILLHLLSFLAGFSLPRYLLGMSERMSRTIAIETGMQSAALGYLLAMKHFENPLIAVPSAVGVLVMSGLGATFAVAWRLKVSWRCSR